MIPVDPIVSIVIPVFDKLPFTRQCLDRLARHAASGPSFEVIVVDNASSDGTAAFFADGTRPDLDLVYVRNEVNEGFSRGNNIGARRARGRYLLFLNNDTIVTHGWLQAMVDTAERDPRVGIVGIKQLFPYTNLVHHTGIVFAADGTPRHIYPHVDGSRPHVNRQREYQAVTGACLLIARDLFDACGGFDEGYRNGYEDIDLCLTVRRRGRSVVCCTSGCIYHYGQISETRTDADRANAARLASRWGSTIVSDELTYFREDRADLEREAPAPTRAATPSRDVIYFADDLGPSSALTWVTAALVEALDRLGRRVAIRETSFAGLDAADRRRALARHMVATPPRGGVHIRWSHYRPEHLDLDVGGRVNLELFVINYLFGAPGTEPWDYWLQSVARNGCRKLALSGFCRDVLEQLGVPAADCALVQPGYAPEIDRVDAPPRRSPGRRLLTLTNSHDLERYGTRLLLDAYWSTFTRRDDVTLVIKDYGASSGETALADLLRAHRDRAAVEYVTTFTSKERLIELYKSCDAFVSAHRGEGFGMKILDALACGLPVVAPIFGGPADFLTPDNCLPVSFAMAPVGDCLDTRALRITNQPMWAEPDVQHLGQRLREIVESPDLGRRLGARGRSDVRDRFTWPRAAERLLTFADAALAERTPPRVPRAAEPARETSAYWLGCRVSVVIPTYNRAGTLRRCLDALERQSILPQEFEVVVVDDGSTDDTAAVAAAPRPFHVTYLRQTNAGPGAARNAGLLQAQGEIVLFIGDDIIADPRLLEAHLLAHATRTAPGTAVLGHIDWPRDRPATAVMDYVTGPASLQFAYALIPTRPSLDFRFFYTSNVSLERRFLADAAEDGVLFDPDFTAAAFEDAEFALRLAARGLEIVYEPDAGAVHDHWMDLESFARRELAAGRMAVVFYRKHPWLDEYLQVRWIADWTQAVNDLMDRPDLQARLRAIDAQSAAFLQTFADAAERARAESPPRPDETAASSLHDAVFAVIFDVARTRGKVTEWYASVRDSRKVDLAATLIACARRLEFLSASPDAMRQARGSLAWLERDASSDLEVHVADLDRRLRDAVDGAAAARDAADPGASLRARLAGLERQLARQTPSRLRLLGFLRRADLSIQYRLHRHARRLLPQYHAARGRLRQWLPGRPPSR